MWKCHILTLGSWQSVFSLQFRTLHDWTICIHHHISCSCYYWWWLFRLVWFQSPANNVSAKVSTLLDSSGEYIMPWLASLLFLSFQTVSIRYLIIFFTDFSWLCLGSIQNLAHWWTTYALSGWLQSTRKFNIPITDLHFHHLFLVGLPHSWSELLMIG